MPVLERNAREHRSQADRQRSRAVTALPPAPACEQVAPEVIQRAVDRAQLESDVAQQAAPSGAREETVDVAVMHRPRLSLRISNQDREVDQVGRVARIRVGGPLQEAHACLLSTSDAADEQ